MHRNMQLAYENYIQDKNSQTKQSQWLKRQQRTTKLWMKDYVSSEISN